jgi:magnesium-transporting ATPase (P-type)
MGKEQAVREVPNVFGDKPAHVRTADDCLDLLSTSVKSGLSADRVSSLQSQYGPNRLKDPPRPSFIKILGYNIANAMTIVLSPSGSMRGPNILTLPSCGFRRQFWNPRLG